MPVLEPPRVAPDPAFSARMGRVAHHGTRPELLLRRELHGRGLRFRLQVKVPGNRRRSIDVALTRARLAVYVDGCFWHGCPQHLHVPAANREWWQWKLAATARRDRDTDRELLAAQWSVLRVWEHEDPVTAADRVEDGWRSLTGRPARVITPRTTPRNAVEKVLPPDEGKPL